MWRKTRNISAAAKSQLKTMAQKAPARGGGAIGVCHRKRLSKKWHDKYRKKAAAKIWRDERNQAYDTLKTQASQLSRIVAYNLPAISESKYYSYKRLSTIIEEAEMAGAERSRLCLKRGHLMQSREMASSALSPLYCQRTV
jgi:hypothetical protein